MNTSPTIQSIEAILVDLPTIRAHKLAMTTLSRQTLVIVRLRTDDGIIGLGVQLDLDKLAFYRRDRASQSVAVTA